MEGQSDRRSNQGPAGGGIANGFDGDVDSCGKSRMPASERHFSMFRGTGSQGRHASGEERGIRRVGGHGDSAGSNGKNILPRKQQGVG